MEKPGSVFPILETERLLLKITVDKITEIFSESKDKLPGSNTLLCTLQNLEETSDYFLNALIDEYNNSQMICWQLWEKQDGKTIGQCEFSNWITAHDRAEIGYSLDQNYWRKGYMTEALHVVIDFGFHVMQLNRIEGRCRVKNVASARLMEKVGMTCEGILRQHIFAKNRYHDLKLYSILRTEWPR